MLVIVSRFSFSFIPYISLSVSLFLSLTTTKKKACTRTPKFLLPVPLPPPQTNGKSFKSLNTSVQGGCLAPNWEPMLEQRINERTLNSVFQISVTTTLFAVFFEKLPLFTDLLFWQPWTLSDFFFPLRREKTDPRNYEGNSSYVYHPSALQIATLCDWKSRIRIRMRKHSYTCVWISAL